jgi:hypothetical protein
MYFFFQKFKIVMHEIDGYARNSHTIFHEDVVTVQNS